MIVVGLTGGIGTGKSTVAAVFREAGAVVVDADRIAREVVAKGRPAWRDIVAHFGRRVLLPDGEIDRKLLGDIIFNDSDQKTRLNQIVHPRVRAETGRQLKEIESTHPKAVVILDVPLLLETGMQRGLSEVILVYVPESIQLQRLRRRDRLTHAEALARVRSQMPIEEKKAKATIIIDNSGTPEETRESARGIFKALKQKSRNQ